MLTRSLGRRPTIEFTCGGPDPGGPPARPAGSWELGANVCGLAWFLLPRPIPRGGPALPPLTSHLQATYKPPTSQEIGC